MKNYDEMSDFEINKLVSLYIGRHPSNEHECLKTGACYLMTDKFDVRIPFNPCNNPSDAWPVISTNHVNIGFNEDGSSKSCIIKRVYGDSCRSHKIVASCGHKSNPLRAAMICFLKMKDAES